MKLSMYFLTQESIMLFLTSTIISWGNLINYQVYYYYSTSHLCGTLFWTFLSRYNMSLWLGSIWPHCTAHYWESQIGINDLPYKLVRPACPLALQESDVPSRVWSNLRSKWNENISGGVSLSPLKSWRLEATHSSTRSFKRSYKVSRPPWL